MVEWGFGLIFSGAHGGGKGVLHCEGFSPLSSDKDTKNVISTLFNKTISMYTSIPVILSLTRETGKQRDFYRRQKLLYLQIMNQSMK